MFDAAIIGAGLAGTSAAIRLARSEHKVLLLEAGKYPRPKVCGEFLSPEALAILGENELIHELESLSPVRIRHLRITAPDGSEWRRDLPAPALGISRFVLDKTLVDYAEKLGVEVHAECRVLGVEGNLREGFLIHCQTKDGKQDFQAASLIAAHGKRSNMDRFLNRDSSKKHRFVGLKQHFQGISLPQQIDLHVFKGGYCGISEVEDGTANVCLLVREGVFQEASGAEHKISQFVEWMSEQNPCLGQYLAEASPVYPDWLSIAQVSLEAKSPIEGDILLAGDAVGMIAPLAGDGMAMALHSGKLAALSLDNFLQGRENAENMKAKYRRQWEKTFRSRLRLGRVIQAVMIEPRSLSLSLNVLKQFPFLGDFLVKQTRDLALLEQKS